MVYIQNYSFDLLRVLSFFDSVDYVQASLA